MGSAPNPCCFPIPSTCPGQVEPNIHLLPLFVFCFLFFLTDRVSLGQGAVIPLRAQHRAQQGCDSAAFLVGVTPK